MHEIKYVIGLIILAFLAFYPLAFGIDVDIAGETIRIPAPDGFTEVKSVSQDTFSFFEDMCPEQNRLLAVFVTQSDAGKLMRGDDADLREYMTVQSVKKLEGMTLAKYQFGELREMLRKEYDSLFQNQEESIDQAITQAGTALSRHLDTEVEFNINGIAPLGVDDETTSSISMSQLVKYNLSVSGENIEHTVAGSMTATLLKGKILYLNVFKTYQDQEDVDWIRSQSAKWLPTIVSANETIWPSSTGGIVPIGTPVDLVTKKLLSETQIEYNMKLHPKAQGLDISIKHPESWKAEEAIRPHIVQKFTGEPVAGVSPFCMLLVQDIPTWGTLLLESELGEEVLIECLREMVPPRATYLDGGATRIDGESGAWLKYYYQGERAGVSVGMYTLQYVLFYSGKMLAIQCAVGGSADDKVMLEDAFTSYLPVFQMIGNSAVINEKWTQSDHYSFQEHLTGWSMVILILIIPGIIALGFGIIRPKKIPTPLPKNPTPPPLPKKTPQPPPLLRETVSKNVQNKKVPMKQWYYAKDGEQKGPVIEDDLIASLQNNEISLDSLIWSKGMPEWASAKDVGLIYAPPANGFHHTESAVQDLTNTSVSEEEEVAHRGIGRGVYFGWIILASILSAVLGAEISFLVFIPILIIGGMRYRNIGYSPWLILLALIPVVNLVVGYQCFALPPGYAQTKQPDRAMKVVGRIYIFCILGIVLAIIIPLLAG